MSIMPIKSTHAVASVLSLVLAASALGGSEMLVNSGFDTPSGRSPAITHTGYGLVGESVAKDWYVFHNTEGTTKTELLPSEISDGFMLRVATDGASNGIEQVIGAFDTGPACAEESIWVYIISGSILIGAGNGGQTAADQFLTTTGQWTEVTATNTLCPVNLFIVYAASVGGAEFYLEKASVRRLDCIGPPGDFNHDGFVNAADLSILLGAWGLCSGCEADLSQDGVVAGADLAILLANWGC
jgi:hypothetical protein